ncbi:MAG: large conductance mechanosensitive channel protein MscL [Planctomycetes bacterium]|nr:large conductance mechanosensitive channel protein MscL [Planctomycetota bacterium]
MGLVKEFRDFAVRGNVMDMAVGVIVGGAFGKIVASLVGDVLMPPIGKALGGVNFKDLYISLDPEKSVGLESLDKAKELGIPVIAYGSFLNVVIDFTILAFCVFIMVKVMNTIRAKTEKPKPAAEPTEKDCPHCLMKVPVKATRCGHCTSDLQVA